MAFSIGLAALAGLLLAVWLGLVGEAVLLRARPLEQFGRHARWRHPSNGLLARGADLAANSRLLGALLEPLPELEVRSDITDVAYVNYIIPASDAERAIPPGLELQRLGPDGRWVLFTFLSYRHGHFGFAFLGWMRQLLPSPIQSNWRLHLVDPQTGKQGIYFLTNAITSTVMGLGARLTAEGMPMHILRRARIERALDGAIRVVIDPGSGAGPDAELELRPADSPKLSGRFAECFADYHALLAYCVPQDRAMSSQPLKNRISRQEIHLGIPISACVPLQGTVRSRAATAIAGDEAPVCFYVPSVAFRFAEEAHDERAHVSKVSGARP